MKFSEPPPPFSNLAKRDAFTLVELLTVVAIMAIVMGAFVLSLGGQSRGLQLAASQLSSGLGFARQLAITRNTHSMLLIAPRRGSSPADFFPDEAFRYWTVVYSNRSANTWTLAKDWTELPSGAVFMGLAGQGYNTLSWPKDGTLPAPGTPFAPRIAASASGEWQYFNSFTDCSIVWPGGSTNLNTIPFVGFKPDGSAYGSPGQNVSHVAPVLGEGSVSDLNQITLRSTNNITHVEADQRSGRAVIRPRESYK
jgi:prepilin-type N-terminal cleavage/methylation domain-containing protein